MTILIRIICIVMGYCFGLFQTAYIYGSLHGIDIRNYGSGNSGTTNALRVLGKKAGLIVFLGDFFKAAIAVTVARVIGYFLFPDIIYPLMIYAGFGVILGHNFPFYMDFKGGKGIAATAGVILGLFDYRIMFTTLIVFIVCVIITRYVSLGSLIVVTLLFSMFVLLGAFGFIKNPGTHEVIGRYELIESGILLFLMAALAFVRHKANIIRLINHEENKVFSSKQIIDTEDK